MTTEGMLESAQTILLCAGHQKRIVDDILTVSKLESSLLKITPVLTNPLYLVRRVTQMFRNEAAASAIDLSYALSQSFTDLNFEWFHCDPTRLTQILINLITNAIKFTKGAEQRKIEVRIGAHIDTPPASEVRRMEWHPSGIARQGIVDLNGLGTGQKTYLSFFVRDTGKGITTDEMSTLFNRFSQANPKTHIQVWDIHNPP